MERLTYRTGKRAYMVLRKAVCFNNRPISERAFCVDCPGTQDQEKCGVLAMIDRLAAYEDTGLEPEEIRKLARAGKPHKGYKIEGFYCPICAKRHDRIIEIDGVYFTHAEAEAALERRKGGTT